MTSTSSIDDPLPDGYRYVIIGQRGLILNNIDTGKVYTKSQSKVSNLGEIKTRYWICKDRKCSGKCTIHFDPMNNYQSVLQVILTEHNTCTYTHDIIEAKIGDSEIIARVAKGQSLHLAYFDVMMSLSTEQAKHLSCKLSI